MVAARSRRDCPAHLSPFRTHPADRAARSRQTAHRNATGGAASRTQGRTCPAAQGTGRRRTLAARSGTVADCPAARSRQTVRRRDCPRTCHRPAADRAHLSEPQTVRRQIAADGAQERHRRRGEIGTGANPSGRLKRHGGRLPPCFRRLCPRPVRQTVRRAMRLYAYASRNAANGCACHLSGAPVRQTARQIGRGAVAG